MELPGPGRFRGESRWGGVCAVFAHLTTPKSARSFGFVTSTKRNSVPQTASFRAGRWNSVSRALRVFLGALLLTTCSTDAIGPGGRVVGVMQPGALLSAAADFGITVDQVVLEVRRVSDNSVAFSRTLGQGEFTVNPDDLRITLNLSLTKQTEDFTFTATARSGGVDYYAATGTITAVAYQSVSSTPITPTYVGPGADATGITLPSATALATGASTTLTAVVDVDGTPVSGVPVAFSSSDSTAIIPVRTGLNAASVTAPATGSGSVTITARTPTALTASGTVSWPVQAGPPATITATSPLTQNAVVNTAAAQAPTVQVKDAGGLGVANATVTFAVTSGGGSVTGGTQTTNAQGLATVGSWILGQTAGPNTLTATVAQLPAVSFSATGTAGAAAVVTKFSGDNQAGSANIALGSPLVVQVNDQFGNPVNNVTVAWATATGSLTPASSTTDGLGRTQSAWTLGNGATQTATATVTGVTPATFTATAGPPAINLAFVGIPDVGVGKTVQVRATLSVPAPAGGVSVTLASDASGTASVAAPASVSVAQNGTTADFTVNGVAIGSTTLRATATSYAPAALPIAVQDRSISVPVTLNVPFGSTASLPINIASPAPVGGVVVNVTSDNPTAVGIGTPTVTINAGATSANATVQGLLPGTANVTVSNPAYTSDVAAVTTSASLNVIETFVNPNASFGSGITIQLTSNGTGIAAPAGGVGVTLTPRAVPATGAACAVTDGPRTITAGLTSTTATISAAPTATLPCTVYVVASATNIQPDSVQVTVNPSPGINLTSVTTVGSGLQLGVAGSLQANNHGGVTVRVASPDPAVVLISPNSTSLGTQTLDIPIAINGSSFSFVVQALEGQTVALPITVSAPGFTSAVDTIKVIQPGLDVIFYPTGGTTTLAANSAFQVRTGLPNTNNTALTQEQALRGGGPGVTATVNLTTAPSTGVATLISGAQSSNSITTNIPQSQSRSGGSAAAGGVELDPLGAPGTATVNATAPGFVSVTTATQSSTISAPVINMSAALTIGGGMQVASNGSLGASNHGGVTVSLAVSDSTKFRLTRNATDTVAHGTLDISLLNGQTGFNYVVQALEGQTGTATITVTAPGFTGSSQSLTAVTPSFDIIFLPTSIASLAPNAAFQVRLGIPNGQLTGLTQEQPLRANSPGITATLAHSNPAVAKLLTSASLDTVTVPIVATQARSPGTVATGGVEYNPAQPGIDTVTASIPGFVAVGNSRQQVTITGQAISMATSLTIGSGMQVGSSGGLGATNYGQDTVYLTVTDSSKFLIAPNGSTVGKGTLAIPMTAPATAFSYTVQVLEGQVGTAFVRASATGFSPDSTALTAVQPGLDIIFLTTSLTTFSPNDPFSVRVGIPNGQNTGLQQEQVLRAGSPGVLASVTSSAPAIGAIVSKAGSSGSATDSIVALTARTPQTTAALGGLEFDPLIGGTTTVSATIPGFLAMPAATVTVNITAPAITISSPTVGAGLQIGASASFGAAAPAGGVQVKVKSSQPGVVQLSPNNTVAPADSILMNLAAGQSFLSFIVSGVDTVTSGAPAIVASADGYTDGNGVVTVVRPSLDLIFVATSTTTATVLNQFQARIGIPNSNNTGLSQEQALRPGAATRTVSITNSNSAVGNLFFRGSGPVQSGTVQIAANSARSPSDTTSNGVGFLATAAGTTTLNATTPGFVVVPSATQTVTVTTPTISVNPITVGAGLQVQQSGFLGAAQHGGVQVTLTSSDPSKVLLSTSATAAGSASIQVPVANNNTAFTYYVQGVEGTTGTANVSVNAGSQFTPTSATETVVQPAADIIFLPSSLSATAANVTFLVRLGIPDALGNSIGSEQALRGGATTVQATVTNSAAAVAQLSFNGGAPTQTGQVTVSANSARSPNTGPGSVVFDPVAQGATSVSVSIPGFRVIPASTFAVTVGP